jgi:hypothetical protein
MEPETNLSNHRNNTIILNIGIGLTIAGFLIFIFGASPGIIGLDRNPYVGFAQTAIFSFGLAMLCLGGFISFKSCQRDGFYQTLAQDIGIRLVATGYIISLISGMADVFGFGTQTWPFRPFFGPQQAAGVVVGEVVIAVGFLLYLPISSAKS